MVVVFITFVHPIAWISIPFFGSLSDFTTIHVNFGVKGHVQSSHVTILCDILFQKLSCFCQCSFIIYCRILRSCYKGQTNCQEWINCRCHSFRRPGNSWDLVGILGISWEFLGILGNSWDLVGTLAISWQNPRIVKYQ